MFPYMERKTQKKTRTASTKKTKTSVTKKYNLANPLFSIQVLVILGVLLILLVVFFYWVQQRSESFNNQDQTTMSDAGSENTITDNQQTSPLNSESAPETIEQHNQTVQTVQTEQPRYRVEEPIPRTSEQTPMLEPVPGPRSQVTIPSAGASDRVPIVIVIDDVGYDVGLLEPFLRIPVPLTYAILPGVAHTRESALLISLYEQEIILHQPMENVLGLDPGPGTLWEFMTDQELRNQLIANIQEIPGIVGMNNHMGSKGTQDRRIMNIILEVVEELGLVFLDSRTTAQSVVRELFNQRQVPFLERHVFLDNESTREAILDALLTGLNQASTRGYAVMIGHVWTQELADLLFELYPEILDQGYDFVSLVDLLQIRTKE